MTDHYAKVRIVQQGGFAGTVPRVELDRDRLGDAEARTMDEAGRQLAMFADAQAMVETEVGADLIHYLVELQPEHGAAISFTVPDGGGLESAMHGPAISSIIHQLEKVAATAR